MSEFEKALQDAAQKALLRVVTDGSWIQPEYNNRFKVPPDLIKQIYALIDVDVLKAQIAARLEAELADRIVNALAAEISTDIKQILSVKERREEVREVARKHLINIADTGVTKQG